MNRLRNRLVVLGVAILTLAVGLVAQQARPKYTIEEYNDFTAATKETESKARLAALDVFLQKYPESTLRSFVYQAYLEVYQKAANWPKILEYADKFLALDSAAVEEVYKRPSQTEEQSKEQIGLLYYQIIKVWSIAFLQQGDPRSDAVADKAATLANEGLQRLEKIAQPANVTPERWVEAKKQEAVVFHTVLGNVAFRKKEFTSAAREYKLVTEHDPKTAFYTYRLGLSYLQSSKPNLKIGMSKEEVSNFWGKPDQVSQTQLEGLTVEQWCYGSYCERAAYFYSDQLKAFQRSVKPTDEERALLGFWAVARSVALFPENQKKNVREFLVSKLRAYQGYADLCPARHVEAQAEELVRQASASPIPPADWKLLAAERVYTLRGELTVKRIFDELKAGGEQRELIWLASCGMELPDLPGKVVEVTSSADNLVTLRLSSGEEAADQDIVNVEVKVKEPPEAKNLKRGDIIRVSGVLSDFQAEPFLLRMTEGRVNPEDIPKEEKPAPRRRPAASR